MAKSIVVSSHFVFWSLLCTVIWMLTFCDDCDITSGFGSPGSVLLKALYLNMRKSDGSCGHWTILNFLQISLACLFDLLHINKFLKLSRFTVFLVCVLLVLKDLWKLQLHWLSMILFIMHDHSWRLMNRTELYTVTYRFSFYSLACWAWHTLKTKCIWQGPSRLGPGLLCGNIMVAVTLFLENRMFLHEILWIMIIKFMQIWRINFLLNKLEQW